MVRDYGRMRSKVAAEGACRVCGIHHPHLQAAHIIQRARSTSPLAEHELNCVPLDPDHHRAYDERHLDLLPYLSVEEQAHAVLVAGGIVHAFERITGARWRV